MLNWIWIILVVSAIAYGGALGTLDAVNQSIFDSAKAAVKVGGKPQAKKVHWTVNSAKKQLSAKDKVTYRGRSRSQVIKRSSSPGGRSSGATASSTVRTRAMRNNK